MSGRKTRAERFKAPRMVDVMQAVAIDHGVCIRPIAFRVTDPDTGETEIVDIPCGATLASKCPSCAERRKKLRLIDCRTGWHLDTEPNLSPGEPSEEQKDLAATRADMQTEKERAEKAGEDSSELDEVLGDIDDQLTALGVRGKLDPPEKPKRTRSTKRRDDVPDLPRRPVARHTVGKVYTSPEGDTFRPSMGLTLTLPSYGAVLPDGTPVDPSSYDYGRAARDAIHFSKLVDRFWQNLRRVVGYNVQYFAAVEPQKRLAPHLHAAMRGTISRAELRQVVAATYASVWWPRCNEVVYDGQRLPKWDPERSTYVDPDTDEPLPTWDQALDALDEDENVEPLHVLRFGSQLHAEGVLAGTPQADKWICYVGKYLTKAVDECHTVDNDRQRAHLERLAETLRYEPCSRTCPNWLRYGVQPKNARPEQRPGYCKGKAHRRETLGFGGRRVLVSRRWSGKTMKDHAHAQREWVLDVLDEAASDAADKSRLIWEPVPPGDPDLTPTAHRLVRAVSNRMRWRARLEELRLERAGPPRPDLSASDERAA